eukprot:4561299-Prymnesium_polylepis.1
MATFHANCASTKGKHRKARLVDFSKEFLITQRPKLRRIVPVGLTANAALFRKRCDPGGAWLPLRERFTENSFCGMARYMVACDGQARRPDVSPTRRRDAFASSDTCRALGRLRRVAFERSVL